MGLLGLWRYVGHYVRLRVEGGMDNGLGVWEFQQAVHLPSEVWVQSWVLPYPDQVVRFLNLYYMSLHLTSMAIVPGVDVVALPRATTPGRARWSR